MITTSTLSEEEEKRIRIFLKQLSKEGKARDDLTFDILITDWSNFVKEVKSGYTLTIDDYTNDLCARDILGEISAFVEEPTRTKINKILVPLDEQFKKATHKIGQPLFSSRTDLWWWYQIPNVLVGGLKKDLELRKLA